MQSFEAITSEKFENMNYKPNFLSQQRDIIQSNMVTRVIVFSVSDDNHNNDKVCKGLKQ